MTSSSLCCVQRSSLTYKIYKHQSCAAWCFDVCIHSEKIATIKLTNPSPRVVASVCVCVVSESESGSVVSDSLQPRGLYSPWNSPGQHTGGSSFSLLQGILPTQGSNPGLPCCRQILYQLSHQGSPRILEWVAYPFPSGSSRPRNRTRVSCVAGGFFTN